MKKKIVLSSTDDLWIMLLSTVRYSMGRRTYMSSVSKELLLRYRVHLSSEQREQITREVERELEIAHFRGATLGDWCDDTEWMNLVAAMRASP